jgi:hypothetical protein
MRGTAAHVGEPSCYVLSLIPSNLFKPQIVGKPVIVGERSRHVAWCTMAHLIQSWSAPLEVVQGDIIREARWMRRFWQARLGFDQR